MKTIEFADQMAARRNVAAHHRILLLLPALCALAYPWLSRLLSAGLVFVHGSSSPDGGIVAVSVALSLALALAVMSVNFQIGRMLGKRENTRAGVRARWISHLAFAAPSLFVGFGNVAGVVRASSWALTVWVIFWAVMLIIVFVGENTVAAPVQRSATNRRLGAAHGVSACAILLLFILPHLGNHLAGFWNGAAHIGVMNIVRQLYRNQLIEPTLLMLIVFQIISGAVLVGRRLREPSDFFAVLQTMAGVYVAVYLLAHTTAAFS